MERIFLKSIIPLGFIFSSTMQTVVAKDYLIAHNIVKRDVTVFYYPSTCRRVKRVKNKSGQLLEKVTTRGVKCPQGGTPHFVKSGSFSNHSPSQKNHNHNHNHKSNTKTSNKIDNNSCKEGSIIGGLLGAGVTMSATRGKDRWWAVPAGGAAGAIIGCQIDGG